MLVSIENGSVNGTVVIWRSVRVWPGTPLAAHIPTEVAMNNDPWWMHIPAITVPGSPTSKKSVAIVQVAAVPGLEK